MNKKQRERKDKKREQENKARKLAKQAYLRKSTANARSAEKYSKTKGVTIWNDPEAKKAHIMNQLERNLAVLEALESEYVKEQDNRKSLNEALEAEGFTTLKEKMDHLSKQAMEGNLTQAEIDEFVAYQETIHNGPGPVTEEEHAKTVHEADANIVVHADLPKLGGSADCQIVTKNSETN